MTDRIFLLHRQKWTSIDPLIRTHCNLCSGIDSFALIYFVTPIIVHERSKSVILLYSQVKWRPLENCVESPTPALNTPGIPQTQCASARGSESCSLSEAWQSFGGQSMPTSHLQICTRPHDRSEQSWLPHSVSEEERQSKGLKKMMFMT